MTTPKQSLPLAQIESTHWTIAQVAELAEIPLDRLQRYCDRDLWLKLGEYERFISVIGTGRIHWAIEKAKKASVRFNRAEAEQESFELALAEMEQENEELRQFNAAMKATNFRKWVQRVEEQSGRKITDLEAAALVFDSVQEVEARAFRLR